MKYEDCSVRLSYKTEIGPHKRTGHLYAVGQESAIFWPLNVSKKIELIIPLEDIQRVELINTIKNDSR